MTTTDITEENLKLITVETQKSEQLRGEIESLLYELESLSEEQHPSKEDAIQQYVNQISHSLNQQGNTTMRKHLLSEVGVPFSDFEIRCFPGPRRPLEARPLPLILTKSSPIDNFQLFDTN